VVDVRPTGVTIIAILNALGGVLCLLAGLMFLAMPGMLPAGMYGMSGMLGMEIGVMGIVMVVCGVLSLVIAYGLWTLKNWARLLVIVFSALGIASNLVSIAGGMMHAVVGIAINAVVIWYMMRDDVKAVFE
jgi:uncharacterized membrane protein (DUF2068 family)